MSEEERLTFLQNGLGVILASAEGFWGGAEAITDRPREAEVLEGFAAEEAAKILILVDLYRCPTARRAEQAGTVVRWYYNHLARLLYSAQVGWRAATKGELRSYIDQERQSHVVDGPVGEWIMSAGPVVERERRLYADVERYDDGNLVWNEPRGLPPMGMRHSPAALRLVTAMRNLGLLTVEGLRAVSDVWGADTLTDDLTHQDALDLKHRTVAAVEAAGAITEVATEADVRTVYEDWSFPMWDFDLGMIDVPMKELEAERDRNLWEEAGW